MKENVKSDAWQWQANLELSLEKNIRGTRLSQCRHHGPLYVQKPFYPEGKDCAHLYLLHPPGGLVSGDELQIDISIGEGAHSLITTPGAARAYRARDDNPIQKQIVNIDVGQHGCIEWFPMETIIYNHAFAELDTVFNLQANSQIMAWEISCFGLPASDQAFTQGHFVQRYRILQDGLPLFIDRLHYNPQSSDWFHNQAGAQNKHVSGFFIARALDGLADQVVDELREKMTAASVNHLIAITEIHGFIISRYLGHSAFQARQLFTEIWQCLRPLLIKRDAKLPGIWKT